MRHIVLIVALLVTGCETHYVGSGSGAPSTAVPSLPPAVAEAPAIDPERARMIEAQLVEEVRVAEAAFSDADKSSREFHAGTERRITDSSSRVAAIASVGDQTLIDDAVNREAAISKLDSQQSVQFLERLDKTRADLQLARDRLKQFRETGVLEPASPVKPRSAKTDRTT